MVYKITENRLFHQKTDFFNKKQTKIRAKLARGLLNRPKSVKTDRVNNTAFLEHSGIHVEYNRVFSGKLGKMMTSAKNSENEQTFFSPKCSLYVALISYQVSQLCPSKDLNRGAQCAPPGT